MPMGLVNAPATFVRWVNSVFKGLDFVKCYVDDFCIASASLTEHMVHLDQMLAACARKGVKLRMSKCFFLRPEVELLGHSVSQEGLRPLKRRVEAIRKFAPPKNKKDVLSFLGSVQFYRAFIPSLA